MGVCLRLHIYMMTDRWVVHSYAELPICYMVVLALSKKSLSAIWYSLIRHSVVSYRDNLIISSLNRSRMLDGMVKKSVQGIKLLVRAL